MSCLRRRTAGSCKRYSGLNSTAVCQPLDVGVMGPLKAKIRSSGRCYSGGSAKEKHTRAINATIAAWDAIKTETIIRCFR
eukprot:jgi/Phyca11/103468/e_gw1.8.473.1